MLRAPAVHGVSSYCLLNSKHSKGKTIAAVLLIPTTSSRRVTTAEGDIDTNEAAVALKGTDTDLKALGATG